jgi:hypothetical protein
MRSIESRRVTGASVEHPIRGAQLGSFQHEGDDVRLRNRLTGADRKGTNLRTRILPSPVGECPRGTTRSASRTHLSRMPRPAIWTSIISRRVLVARAGIAKAARSRVGACSSSSDPRCYGPWHGRRAIAWWRFPCVRARHLAALLLRVVLWWRSCRP